ncbi:MAG: aminoacetone oxidase family FAD-binding enzyme [Bacteroidaceae bacterium]|nr:aminoacetone oxidase family FAD-binding enzyme [Bacteroidaceae bacterium]
MPQSTAIIGGGAAGFFLAITLRELCPDMHVCILERQRRVLAKVEITGGGRCNCTNTFQSGLDLQHIYPRGHRQLKGWLREFSHHDAYEWFEHRGVPLVAQPDGCVFPQAQDSHAIINLFLRECRRLGVEIRTGIDAFDETKVDLSTYDNVCICTGGLHGQVLSKFNEWGLQVVSPIPSLFTFNIADPELTALMGTVVEDAVCSLPGTKLHAQGPLLITHWGMSGPSILKLSSRGARILAECQYKHPLSVNWTGGCTTDEVLDALQRCMAQQGAKLIDNVRPYNLQNRLWDYLLTKLSLRGRRCSELGRKQLNRLAETLTHDTYDITGRSHYKEEFVTCGGISLSAIDRRTLRYTSPHHAPIKNLYFAGEVLDIDGITGGYNLQAAWTTATIVARGIKCQLSE